MTGDIQSPCTNLCQLDPASGWCFGCGRTGSEIARWIEANADERRAILERLPVRLACLANASQAASAK